jgi:hypothetical protein
MIPPLVRLPATRLEPGSIDALAACVGTLGRGATVLVGDQRTATDEVLDGFVVAAALAARGVPTPLGIAVTVGEGRVASIVAREATAAQLLGSCDVLLLEGAAPSCRDAARVIGALFTEGVHTVTTPSARIVDARNRPLPDVEGGPPVRWREGDDVVQLVGGEVASCGRAVEVAGPLPAPAPGVLVVVTLGLSTPAALAAALSR